MTSTGSESWPATQEALFRIGKTAAAVAGGVGAYAVGQVLLPPVFIHSYGIQVYGEWLTLSAAAAWMVNLDLGMQAYVVNQVSIEYFRGNIARVREIQSVALWITLAVVCFGLTLSFALLFGLPLNELLHLKMTRWESSVIALALVSQMLGQIAWGQVNGILQAVGYPQRAHTWQMLRMWLYIGLTLAFALARFPLWTIALGQLGSYFLLGAISFLDLRGHAPEVLPSLRFWDKRLALHILKPSLWFGSFSLGQFIVFQVPILALNQFAGKTMVVSFSICRTYFGLLKQTLMPVRWAMRPEFARCAGQGDWRRLGRAYALYEKLGLAAAVGLVPITLAAAPILVRAWTGRSELFVPALYAAMALAAVGFTLKDSQLELQYSINRHERAAAICLTTYGAFAAGVVPVGLWGGGLGITLLWAVAEFLQAGLIGRENATVLHQEHGSSNRFRAAWLIPLCLACGYLGSLSFRIPIARPLHWAFILVVPLSFILAYKGSGLSQHKGELLSIGQKLFRSAETGHAWRSET